MGGNSPPSGGVGGGFAPGSVLPRLPIEIGTGLPPPRGSYLFLDKKVTKPERSESMTTFKNNKHQGINQGLHPFFM
ncbi:hypothetical protein [Pedobacter sp. R-06]|uniref:hypothetical protein n=1 Tax=Pedobacter sp. R-06 TaxID=3404051 RepID=UPI003CEEEE8B